MASKDTMGLLLLGKPKQEKPLMGGGSEGEVDDSGALDAAKSILSAIKADDATALSEALSLHYRLCEMPETQPE
jgi:hypothetical protein